MTDPELFSIAAAWARIRRDWLARAARGGSTTCSRRQCLAQARKAEGLIVNLAITAEKRARREQQGAAA